MTDQTNVAEDVRIAFNEWADNGEFHRLVSDAPDMASGIDRREWEATPCHVWVRPFSVSDSAIPVDVAREISNRILIEREEIPEAKIGDRIVDGRGQWYEILAAELYAGRAFWNCFVRRVAT